jgi:hypothetical protein
VTRRAIIGSVEGKIWDKLAQKSAVLSESLPKVAQKRIYNPRTFDNFVWAYFFDPLSTDFHKDILFEVLDFQGYRKPVYFMGKIYGFLQALP